MIQTKLDHYYKSQIPGLQQQQQQSGQQIESGSGSGVTSSSAAIRELCHPSCWCNNLVEITCRYPTKVIKYVSLIENNPSTMHLINRSLFEKSIKLSVLQSYQANLEVASLAASNGVANNLTLTESTDDDEFDESSKYMPSKLIVL
jgi:hypothetical protein